ncbi:MAG: hypothetical protein FWE90_09575 [Defluviitaleaceae bacterium]|nr:hypothetical protein [Defluviitaleaceae bacterium]
MKLFSERTVIKRELSDVRCNACGKEVGKDASGYLLDHVSLSKQWGYHSPFDGESHAIDLCIACYQKWIGAFEIPPAQEQLYVEERFAIA